MSLVTLALFASQAYAAASPDLTTTIIAPTATPYVYASAQWQVRVNNIGTKDAANTVLTIQLPETNTSPSVYVMGTLGAKSSSCTRSGTHYTCTVGTVRKSSSTTVYFYITLPESAGTLDFSATASTTTPESNALNNGSSAVAAQLNYSPSFSGAHTMTNRHCTGTGLESFYECELFPSSISSHTATFNADGSISFTGMPDYGGSWSVSGSQLWFEYTELGSPIADFVGYGVDASCWEGITTFPASTYVSPYEVCL